MKMMRRVKTVFNINHRHVKEKDQTKKNWDEILKNGQKYFCNNLVKDSYWIKVLLFLQRKQMSTSVIKNLNIVLCGDTLSMNNNVKISHQCLGWWGYTNNSKWTKTVLLKKKIEIRLFFVYFIAHFKMKTGKH